MKGYVHLWEYLTELFLEWKVFQTKDVEKTKTHILFILILTNLLH